MRLINKTRQVVISEKVTVANTFFSRLVGLLATPHLDKNQALLLKPAQSIHTFFMCYPIDIMFVDKYNRVIAIYACLKPWHLTRFHFAAYAVEFSCGRIKSSNTSLGDIIEIEE